MHMVMVMVVRGIVNVGETSQDSPTEVVEVVEMACPVS